MAIIGMFDHIDERLQADKEFQVKSDYFTCDLMIADDSERLLLRFNNGDLIETLQNPMPIEEFDFSITASESAWKEFFRPFPSPGFHEVFAAVWLGNMMIEGNMKKFMQHYTAIARLLKVIRTSINN